jgi:hypothetical protein
MKRDLIILPITNNKTMVIATDCSGACGEMPNDIISVSPEVTAYYTARVAFMEVMSVGATPIAYTFSNFIKDKYDAVQRGILKLIDELGLDKLDNIGSTETNFEMVQSAVGITVIGTIDKYEEKKHTNHSYACIGYPLIGDEVVNNPDKILSMKDFLELVNDKKVDVILPIGSKGIKWEMKSIFGKTILNSEVDIDKSAGPSTCVVIGFKGIHKEYLKKKFGKLFNFIDTVI